MKRYLLVSFKLCPLLFPLLCLGGPFGLMDITLQNPFNFADGIIGEVTFGVLNEVNGEVRARRWGKSSIAFVRTRLKSPFPGISGDPLQ